MGVLRRQRKARIFATVSALLLFGAVGAAYAVGTGRPKAGPSEAVAFANVLEDGTLDPTLSSDNLNQAAVTHPAAGVYCFANVGFTINSAVVSGDNSFGNNDTIASVAIQNTGEPLAGCPDAASSARVRTLDADGAAASNGAPYAPALVDHRFIIWLRGSKN
jgi:hypothetical protein